MLKLSIHAIAALAILLCGAPVRAQSLADTYFQFDYRASPLRLQALRLLPGMPIREVVSYDVGSSGLSSAFDPIVFDARSGELWSTSQLQFPVRLRRFELQGNQVVATQDTIPITVTTASNARFDEDGYLVICNHAGLVTTVDLRERRVVRTMRIQNAISLGTFWFEPARRGRPAMADFREVLPGSDRQVVATLDEQGAVLQSLYSVPSSVAMGLPLSSHGLTTEDGRSFVTGAGWPVGHALDGFFELTSGGLQRWSAVAQPQIWRMLEDPSREILYLDAQRHGGRVEVDLRTNQVRFVSDPQMAASAWFHSLGFFPRQRLMLSPTQPPASTPFDCVLALGGEPGSLALVLFRHARVGGIPQLEINTPIALSPFDANGLQRTVLLYDPLVFPMQGGDELTFQGFTWDGQVLGTTSEAVLRWR